MALIITGGQWQSRKIATPNHNHVRPTTGRVRESLFARLSPYLPGARFLDGFAGTGIMGLEALSRGAEHVLAIEAHRGQCKQLLHHHAAFGINDKTYTVKCASLENMLKRRPETPYDIIYLDPPYADVTPQWWAKIHPLFIQNDWLHAESLFLLEFPTRCNLFSPLSITHHSFGDTQIAWLTYQELAIYNSN